MCNCSEILHRLQSIHFDGLIYSAKWQLGFLSSPKREREKSDSFLIWLTRLVINYDTRILLQLQIDCWGSHQWLFFNVPQFHHPSLELVNRHSKWSIVQSEGWILSCPQTVGSLQSFQSEMNGAWWLIANCFKIVLMGGCTWQGDYKIVI